MADGASFFPWSGVDQRLVVDEMLRNEYSKHWEECSKFVERCVRAKAKDIPDNQEEIIQEVMYKVTRYLPHFRFECTFKTWLNQIVASCIVDFHRRTPNEERFHSFLTEQLSESDHESGYSNTNEEMSAEDAFMTDEKIREGWRALQEYVNTHSNPTRNRLIIWMVISEGRTHVETAKAAGCSAPVVGYVIRQAQLYARKEQNHKL